MKIVFDGYIDNPNGSAVISNRSMYKNMYQSNFDALLVKEQGNIKFTLYRTSDRFDSHYVHFKIPSESTPGLYYDTVIQLYADDNGVKSSKDLRRYYVRFFSNDASFVFTFAHSFVKNDLVIKDLKTKLGKYILKTPATVRNPNNEVWYVKSLYFAYLAMQRYNLFYDAAYDRAETSITKLKNNVMPVDLKLKQQNDIKEIEKEKKKVEKLKSNNSPPPIRKDTDNIKNITKTSKVAKTGKISPKTKYVKTVKASKR